MRKFSNLELTICSSFKNREEHLRTVLPTWLPLPFKECVIVDWSSKIPLYESIADLVDERFKIVRVLNEGAYNAAIIHNFCMGFAKTQWILRIDGDIIINYRKLMDMEVEYPFTFYRGGLGQTANVGTQGTILIPRWQFQASGGYDERHSGYGSEDIYFYQRLQQREVFTEEPFPKQSLIHIDHDNETRVRDRGITDIYDSMKEQAQFSPLYWNRTMEKYQPTEYEVWQNGTILDKATLSAEC